MKLAISNRLQRLESTRRGVPLAALIVSPLPGEDNQAAQARTLAAHPEMSAAPIIFLGLSREAPCEAT